MKEEKVSGNYSPPCVILGKQCFVFQRLALAKARENISIAWPRISLATRSSGQEKSLFFKEKQAFSSPRMTHVGQMVNG